MDTQGVEVNEGGRVQRQKWREAHRSGDVMYRTTGTRESVAWTHPVETLDLHEMWQSLFVVWATREHVDRPSATVTSSTCASQERARCGYECGGGAEQAGLEKVRLCVDGQQEQESRWRGLDQKIATTECGIRTGITMVAPTGCVDLSPQVDQLHQTRPNRRNPA